MTDTIISRELIASRAEQDAIYMVATGVPAACPYPQDGAAAIEWKASLERYLVLHSSPDGEQSA